MFYRTFEKLYTKIGDWNVVVGSKGCNLDIKIFIIFGLRFIRKINTCK